MKTSSIILGIFVFIALIGSFTVLGTYNGLARGEVTIEEAWSKVETQYQRRYDLIGNLVNATKGFLKQEQAVFGAIAEARTKYAGAPSGSSEKVQAASQMESALARLMVIVENYPQLRSADTVTALMDELTGTENRVAIERNRYNEEVAIFNRTLKTFPKNLIAGAFGFESKPFFKADEGKADAPAVDLTI